MTSTESRPRLLDRAFLRSSAVIAVAIAVMNVTTYGYTIIAAHTIGKDAYGAFSALMGALLVISVLSLGLQATGARRIAAHPGQVVAIEQIVLGVGLRSALGLGAICLVLAPVLNYVLRLESLPTALLVCVAAVPLTYMGAQAGVLQGERRWEPLALVYLSAGLGRIILGTGLILVSPGEFSAMLGVALGSWVPVIVGWVALRRPRVEHLHSEGHPGLELMREVGTSSQALLAFFALSNADILIARAVMSDSEAGLYASGLIMVKAILFFPQFVVVIAFPSMSEQGASRKTLAFALGVSATLGSLGVLATLFLPDLALLFVGGDEFSAIKDDLWKFAIVGTLLAMLQLLVYSALARRQGRAILIIWTALAVLVGFALSMSFATSLVLLVAAVDGVLFVALFSLAASQPTVRPATPTLTDRSD
ncbi:polysaccharide biosynthesis protein [Nocardioides sp.]|uniref:lipopolysaccharide biosynthesis protein n=1 Tax=Nocardioides sp. TaxID=35761 RepID=UPI001A26B024|nr:polysaccharide biosynthesis protein [Nocardioides sp.]MBJ7355928.1 polysaccharide biosynthesis protein [Nocardioides sp.]